MAHRGLIACFVVFWVTGCALLGQITPQQAAQVTDTAVAIERCKAEGRDAGQYRVYDECMRDAGLR